MARRDKPARPLLGMASKMHYQHPVHAGPSCALGQDFPTTSNRRLVTCLNCRESVAYRAR